MRRRVTAWIALNPDGSPFVMTGRVVCAGLAPGPLLCFSRVSRCVISYDDGKPAKKRAKKRK